MPTLAQLGADQAFNATPEADIEVTRGDDQIIGPILFRDRRSQEPDDWTGWTFAAKVKTAIDGTLLLTGTVNNGGTDGTVTIMFPSAQTILLLPDAVGVWDLQGTDPDGYKHTILKGDVTVKGDVT